MPLVDLSRVYKSFGAHRVLDGIDLAVESGETVAIIGRSGSGKSTLLRCINGLEAIDSGSITIDGTRVEPRRIVLRAIHHKVGIVFQSFNLFPHLSVERNVTLGPIRGQHVAPAEARRRARHALEAVGLLDKIDAYPARLSGGQQQRVAIARALAMEPKLLLFDEITSALDPELTGEVVQVLSRLAGEGRTMILVTHEIGFARNCASRVVFMHDGKVHETGPAAATLGHPRTDELRSFLSLLDHGDAGLNAGRIGAPAM